MGVKLDRKTTHIHDVRDVAPHKHMGCATFVIPKATVDSGDGGAKDDTEDSNLSSDASPPAKKKPRIQMKKTGGEQQSP
jgi:hypothetical protein